MTFISLEFGAFLGMTVVVCAFLRNQACLAWLLAANLFFYACWNPWYAIIVLASAGLNYISALGLEWTGIPARRKQILGFSLFFNLGLLAYFKYTHFGLAVLRDVFGPLSAGWPTAWDILLPVGISFYTFQAMAYTIDVYRGHQKAERNFPLFAVFITYFPQVAAGPIERASSMLGQFRQRPPWNPAVFEEGFRLLLWGLFKKLVIADRISAVVQPLFRDAASHSAPDLVFSALGLLTMLYFDFSSCIDMARGSSLMLGIRLSLNFDRPLMATSMADFWRRWHITLGTWVRDYVFIPLGGYRVRNTGQVFRTVLITMGLVGLWHGAQWTYVVWGLYHGLLLALQILWNQMIKRRFRNPAWIHHPCASLAGWMLTMTLHLFSMILFFSTDLAAAWQRVGHLFQPAAWMTDLHPATVPGMLVLSALWLAQTLGGRHAMPDALTGLNPPLRAGVYLVLLCLILTLAAATHPTFVYIQF